MPLFQGGNNGNFLIGEIKVWGGLIATIPSGYLLCNHASLLRASYPALFAAIGTAHGASDGTHFYLPDLTDNFICGASADNAGLVKANPDGAGLVQNGGTSAHNHTGTTDGHTHGAQMAGVSIDAIAPNWDISTSTDTFSTGNAYTIPPFWAAVYIIKT